MSVQQQPIFPITLEELRQNPAIKEHWPHISRPIIGYLLTYLQRNVREADCTDRAQAEAGASRAIGHLIDQFISLGNPTLPKPLTTIKNLNRFSQEEENKPSAE